MNDTIHHKFPQEYKNVNVKKVQKEEHIIRDESLKEFSGMGFDYYLNMDANCIVTNKELIHELLSYGKNITKNIHKYIIVTPPGVTINF